MQQRRDNINWGLRAGEALAHRLVNGPQSLLSTTEDISYIILFNRLYLNAPLNGLSERDFVQDKR